MNWQNMFSNDVQFKFFLVQVHLCHHNEEERLKKTYPGSEAFTARNFPTSFLLVKIKILPDEITIYKHNQLEG